MKLICCTMIFGLLVLLPWHRDAKTCGLVALGYVLILSTFLERRKS